MHHRQVEQARAEELAEAFRLLFARLGRAEQAYRVGKALTLIQQGELDPAGVFVVRGVTGLEGVMACAPVPGAGGIVWPPAVLPVPSQSAHEVNLIAAACAWLRRRGARLAQCLLTDDEMPLARPLLEHGFRHVTWLAYLEHDLVPFALSPGRLTIHPYDPGAPAVFHHTLERTYGQTLDCPEVNGVRTVAEVIEGHTAQGRFDPSRWWLACRDGEPVGVLILIEQDDPPGWEVAYMGVVPEARRQGIGRELLFRALAAPRRARAARLMLSVDERNTPARELYRRLGFRGYDRRAVLLAVWPGGSAECRVQSAE